MILVTNAKNVGQVIQNSRLNKSGYITWKFLLILFLDDLDVPIKKNKNRKNERDEIMAVIRKNPEDFGGSSSDSSEDFKPIKK